MHNFIQTIIFYCQGRGSPWRLILIWYFLLNIVSLVLGFSFFFLSEFLGDIQWIIVQLISAIIMITVGILGVIITFIYPLIFIYALWKCAFNVKWEPLGFFIGFLSLPFLFAHFCLGYVYLFASYIMFYGGLSTLKKIGTVMFY